MVAPEADLYRDPAEDADNQHHLPPPSLPLDLQSPPSPSTENEKEDGVAAKEGQETGSDSRDPVPGREKRWKSHSRFYRVFFHIVCFLFFTG